MYISQEISARIKELAKVQGVQIKAMLSSCELGINTLANMNSGRMLSSDSLGKIADYLDCSVDFLLGRTDAPQIKTAAPIQLDEGGSNVMLLAGRDGQHIKIQLSDEQYQMVYKMFCSFPDADNPEL